MFFNSFLTSSKLKKYNFDSYDLDSREALANAAQDVLAVANILLEEPINKSKDLRYDAGAFLSDWMCNTDEYMFGTGNLKNLFDEKVEFAIISLAAQIKYCLEDEAKQSSLLKERLGVWGIIASYFENPKNKVKLTPNLRNLINAKNTNKLAEFLEYHDHAE